MSKKNYILLAVFLVMLAGAVAYQYYLPILEARRNASVANPLAALDLSGLDRIEADSQGLKLAYLNQGQGWKIDKSPYNLEKGRAEAFVSWLKTAATGSAELASNTEQSAASFGLDKKAQHFVLSRQGKKIADFKIGNATPDGSGFYLAESGKDTVYLIDSSLEIQGIDWRSRKISRLEAAKATEAVLSKGKTVYRYSKAVDGFKPQGQALAGFDAAQAIAGFATLEAQGWPRAGQCVINSASLAVTVQGKVQALELGKNTDAKQTDQACVKLAGQNPWYLAASDQVAVIFGLGK